MLLLLKWEAVLTEWGSGVGWACTKCMTEEFVVLEWEDNSRVVEWLSLHFGWLPVTSVGFRWMDNKGGNFGWTWEAKKLLNSMVKLRTMRLILRTQNIISDNQVVCGKHSGQATQSRKSREIVLWLRWLETTLAVHNVSWVQQGPTDVNSALLLKCKVDIY